MQLLTKKPPEGDFLTCGQDASYQSRVVKNYRVATEDITHFSHTERCSPFQKDILPRLRG